MKKVLTFLTLLLTLGGVASAEDNSKRINLTCINNDRTLSQTVVIFPPVKTKKLTVQLGMVNGHVVTVDVTDATYILKHEIGPEGLPKEKKIQVIYVIDRTTGVKEETWIMPDQGIDRFLGKCQLVKPKF